MLRSDILRADGDLYRIVVALTQTQVDLGDTKTPGIQVIRGKLVTASLVHVIMNKTSMNKFM